MSRGAYWNILYLHLLVFSYLVLRNVLMCGNLHGLPQAVSLDVRFNEVEHGLGRLEIENISPNSKVTRASFVHLSSMTFC